MMPSEDVLGTHRLGLSASNQTRVSARIALVHEYDLVS
jgi:hypothetical protein